ncbi:MAG: adenosine deaminase, partial [Paeniclostridium sordellii]|nr:adenosine deaminase [Paeniclostridium sordellii]
IPKGELHNHGGLGMKFETIYKYTDKQIKKPSENMYGIKGLDDFIFNEYINHVKTKNDFLWTIEETVKEAINDGITKLEASIDCHEILRFEDENNFFNSIYSIVDKYNDKIEFKPEIGVAKSITDENLKNLVPKLIESGVFRSIDLYGDESITGFERYKDYYKYAKEKGLKLKAHAGEFLGANNVKEAVEVLNLDEIQHGFRAIEDEYVVDMIKERNIRLNICPTSNVYLKAIDNIKNHPVKELFNKGVDISINTDDLIVFDSNVSEEYLMLYNNNIFSVEELDLIRLNSIK